LLYLTTVVGGKNNGVRNRIYKILTDKGISQAELARRSQINRFQLNKIINNKKRGVSLKTAFKIAKALNMKIEEVFFFEEKEET